MVALAQLIPFVQWGLVLAVVGIGAWALAPWRSRTGRAGVNVPAVLAGAAVVGVLGGVALGWLLGFGCFDAGPGSDCRSAFLPIQAAAGGGLAVTSIVSYALFIRLRWPTPLFGSVLGPVALAVAVAVLGTASLQVTFAAQRELADQAAAQVVSRSATLHATVGNVRVTMGPTAGVVDGVGFTVTLHVDREIRLDASTKISYPRFSLLATGGEMLDSTGSQAMPTKLVPATDTTWDLIFVGGVVSGLPVAGGPTSRRVASTFTSPTEGTWHLNVQIVDEAGAEYETTVDVVISGAA
jgi:hypothetical protein